METEILPEIISNEEEMSLTPIMKGILEIIKDTEEKSNEGQVKLGQKKAIATEAISQAFPEFYVDNKVLVSVLIDSFVLISNNPFVIQVEKKCMAKCFSCCK